MMNPLKRLAVRGIGARDGDTHQLGLAPRPQDRGAPPPLDFDAWTKAVARGVPRREVLRGLGGMAVTLFAGLELKEAIFPRAVLGQAALPRPRTCDSSAVGGCLKRESRQFMARLVAGQLPNEQSLGLMLAGNIIIPALVLTGLPIALTAAAVFAVAELIFLTYQLNQYIGAVEHCLGPGAGCPTRTRCTNSRCCPRGQVGCGVVCLPQAQCCAGQPCAPNQAGSALTSTHTNQVLLLATTVTQEGPARYRWTFHLENPPVNTVQIRSFTAAPFCDLTAVSGLTDPPGWTHEVFGFDPARDPTLEHNKVNWFVPVGSGAFGDDLRPGQSRTFSFILNRGAGSRNSGKAGALNTFGFSGSIPGCVA